ncbi:MAG: transcriptional regulator GcvA [Paralcaligenes sp.]
MTNRLPPLHALTAFESVARNNSFTKAAEELCITHGAVSHRIKLLETHLGVPVLERGSRRSTLTRAGTAYLHAITEALAILHNAERNLPDKARSQRLKVNALPAFAGNWLIERLEDFQKKYPDIEIEVDPLTHSLSQFDSLKLDVAIRYGSGLSPNLLGIKLKEIRLYPVCSPHYLSQASPIRHPEDLLKESLLRHNADPWEPWFQAAGVFTPEPKPVATFGDARLVLDAAAEGHGIALARDMLTHTALRDGTLVRLFDINVVSSSSYFALFKSKPAPQPHISAFIDWLLDQSKLEAT